mmetsp:Transcript_10901/g.10522  ORF Transcript_10901/g.10522 Transcript_10901/m.10522 type:complete len:109 (+) Transcript_10901:154-480(+)
MCALITFAKCCSIFSVTGFLFLIVIGILLQKQPLYIKGPKNPAEAAIGCYEGAVIYLATFILSMLYWTYDEIRQGKVPFSSNRPPSPALGNTSPGGNTYGAVAKSEGR